MIDSVNSVSYVETPQHLDLYEKIFKKKLYKTSPHLLCSVLILWGRYVFPAFFPVLLIAEALLLKLEISTRGVFFMGNSSSKEDLQGSVMVVGGGIAGMQAALDLANSGFYVYMVEKSPAIGGAMAQLDKTFPTNDCSM